jgi:hypothetical protein
MLILHQQMAGKLSIDTFEALLDVLEKATGMAQPVGQSQAELLFMSKLGMDKRAYQVILDALVTYGIQNE